MPQLTGRTGGGHRARPSALEPVRPLVVEELDVAYGDVQAVRALTFSVGAGSVVGLLGPNGCGKTSTIRAVVGVCTPASGRIVANGVAQPALAARGQIAYVPDEPDGFDELAASEYAALVGVLHRADAGYRARCETLFGAFGLGSRLRVRLGALSHGQRRTVAAVAAFALGRPLVVVDEATAALDPPNAVALREAVRAAAAAGAGVLVATQDLAFAERACDSVVFLSNGECVGGGETRALAPLEEAFLAAVGSTVDREGIRRGVVAR